MIKLVLSLVLTMTLSFSGTQSESLVTDQFLAATEAEAVVVAKNIDFLWHSEFEHPSNMCGPLAGAILFVNKLLPTTALKSGKFDPSFFWLATPQRLDNLFEKWEKIEIDSPVWEIDFKRKPLQLGDLVYLKGGMFDHILVVTKVEDDKAFTVTNLYTKEGWVIREAMLYDLRNETGLFYQDFRNPNSWTGQTGLQAVTIYRDPTKEQLVSR